MGEIKRERENGGLVDELFREVEIIVLGKIFRCGKGGSEKFCIFMFCKFLFFLILNYLLRCLFLY